MSVNAKGANRNNPGEHGVGALAGVSRGLIYHTYSNGVVTGEGEQRNVGGLVGYNEGRILASYSQAKVTGDYKIGGLVGLNKGSILWTYATGNVRNSGFDGGGLVGDQSNDAEIKYSYSTGDVNQGFGTANAGGLISGSDDGTITQSYFDSDRSNRPSSDSYSKTSSALQSPTSASGIFSDWDKFGLIYQGTLTRGIDGRLYGYNQTRGELSPTAIGDNVIKSLFFWLGDGYQIHIKIETSGGSRVNAEDVLSTETTVTLTQGSTTLTSPITSIDVSIRSTNTDAITLETPRGSLASMFQNSNPITISFSEDTGGTDHTVDVPNLWDFGTSNDLPLLSVDFNGDGSASVSEFGEQVDETKPVITINGDDTTYVITGSTYTDAGATVIDPRNHRYTGVVTTTIRGPSGQTSFDSAVLGDWTFTYSAPADSAGNVPNPVARVVKVITRPTAQTSLFHAKYKPGNWIIQSDSYHGHLLPDNNTLTDSDGVAHNTFTYNSVTYTFQQLSYIGDGSLFDLVIKEGSNNLDEETVFADVSLVFIDENDDVWVKPIKDYDSRLRLKSQQEYCCSPFVSVIPWKRWRGTDTTIYVYLIDTAEPETDEIKPIITLNGDQRISFVSGIAYTDAGATVADPGNSDYTGVVTTTIRGPSGQTSFDNTVVGSWTFTYTAPADSEGNVPNSVTRVVTVIALPSSVRNAIFSATFSPSTVISVTDGFYGHEFPDHNALTDGNGEVHHSFTHDGVQYTVDEFYIDQSSPDLFFELKSENRNVDERTIFANYFLAVVNESGEVFTEDITNFSVSSNRLVKGLNGEDRGTNPFTHASVWSDFNSNNSIVGFYIVRKPSSAPATDRDRDNDGLIEISTLAQLHAIRHDSNGNGYSIETEYNTQFESSLTNSGCPSTCTGYELTVDLDFDTNGDDSVDSSDDYYNSGSGWLPIGDGNTPFNTTFNGNGYTISNLTIDRDTSRYGGLFGELGADAVVRNLGLEDASVNAKGANQNNPGEHGVGALAGVNRGTIYHTYSTGVVTGEGAQRHTGGLVGRNFGYVLASYSSASVTGNYDIGGLVGYNDGSVIWTYAKGDVSHRGFDGGGLVGDQSSDATIAYSYSTSDVTPSFSNGNPGGLISGSDDGTITQSYFDEERSNRTSSDSYSKTSSALQSPTDDSGIFSDWAKAESVIYEGEMRVSSLVGAENKRGYVKNNFGSLSPRTIESNTIEELFFNLSDRKLFIKLTKDGFKVDSTDLLLDANIAVINGSTTLTSPITNINVDSSADEIVSNLPKSRLTNLFDASSRFTIRFSNTIGGTDHTVDVPNIWDFGTSDDLPLLSADLNGDGTASVGEFGEQVDEQENTTVSLDFDGNGTFTPSQDALSLYLVTQLSATATTLASYVHDGSTTTAGATIATINGLTSSTSLDFDGSNTFVPSQDALSLYLVTQLSATATTLASYVHDGSTTTAGTTITLINELVASTNR